MSTIWTASGKCSSAKFQIQGAPSPRRAWRGAVSGLAQDALGERRGLGVGIAGGDGFDGGVVGGRAGVAHRAAFLVLGLRRPHDGEFGLSGFGGSIGLLARAVLDLTLASRHAGAVEVKIEGGGIAGIGVDDAAFVAGDLAPEYLGVSFHRLRCDDEAGEFAQQGAGRGDAEHT